MLKRVTITIVCLLILAIGTTQAASKPQLEYITTREGIAYSVDVNSVRLPTKDITTFWITADAEDYTYISCVAVSSVTKKFRFDEGYTYSKQQRKVISNFNIPTKWGEIKQGSIAIMALTILAEHNKQVDGNS